MESRKVQKVGYSTLSVSLPKEWTTNVSLKPGDLVMFSPERDGSLKLMPSKLVESEAHAKEFVINSDLCDEPGMLERVIVGNYTIGRDVLTIVSSNRLRSTHIEEVRNIARRLFGLGIVEETPNRIVLQCSIDPTKFKIDMLMRRLALIASTIQLEAVQALIECNHALAEDAIHREDEADMIYWLALRLLLSAQHFRPIFEKIGLKEPSEILYYGLIVRHLELIADYAESIARIGISSEVFCLKLVDKHVINRINNLSELAHNLFLKAMDCVFNGDIHVANSLLEVRKDIKSEYEILMRELPQIPTLRAVAWALVRIADNGAGVSVIAINKALEKPSRICAVYSSPA